jgi:branched-chain amino acid aminotransferase
MNKSLIYFRGCIVAEEDAQLSVLSPMAQFGLNVFEGVRCYWNKEQKALYAFRLDDHLNRLMQSCKLVKLSPPDSICKIRENFHSVICANKPKNDVAIRITIFVDGQGSWHASEPVSMFIALAEKPRTNIRDLPGFKACITSWERINDNTLPPRAKVGANYINGRYAHIQAKYDGYDFPIFLGSDGKLAEGAGACLFIVRNNKLVTPPKTSSILESITRDTVIRLAEELGYQVDERPIDRTEVYLADEVFFCGTAAELSPIVSVDRFEIGNGRPGIWTAQLLKLYLEVASGDISLHPEWREMVYSK